MSNPKNLNKSFDASSSGCGGRNVQGDCGHGGGSIVGNEQRKQTRDLSTLPRFEKHFNQEHSTTSQRTKDMVQQFYTVNQITYQGQSCPKPILSLQEANFPEHVVNALKQHKWVEPTPIQAQGWSIALSGRDLVGIADIESEKTLSYIVPAIIHSSHPPHLAGGEGPICLVLVPTQEVAEQVAQVASVFGSTSGIRCTCVSGAVTNALQVQELEKGTEICIATPSRLIDLLEGNGTNLRRCTYLVLDGADRMLDMGFERHMIQIADLVRADRQTLMWSAAWTTELETLATLFLSDYLLVNFGSGHLQGQGILTMDDVCEDTDGETRPASITDSVLLPGKQFASFDTASQAIADYQRNHGVQFYRRDARKIESNRVKRNINPALIYYDLRYCCIHGGRKFAKSGSGLRETSTFKQACGAYIHLSANGTGDSLVVRSIDESHNHEIHKELFRHLPHQRKVPDALRSEVQDLLKLKANKKLVQHYVVEKSGSLPTLKDLSNIMQGTKGETRNDLPTFVNRLQNKYGATVDVLADDAETLRGLVFQDAGMKEYMRSFPEVLFIDATYKLLEIRMPIYLTLCEDSMGHSEIVSVGMLASENEETLSWMFQTLRARNTEMDRVRVIVTDKDLKERQVLRQCFPNSCLLLCLFHTLRAFRREVTCEKMGISSGQRSLCLELLQKLAYARSEMAYADLYERLVCDAPHTVVRYYNDNWHGIRQDWVLAFTLQVGNFLNTTNNRIECINSKLKSVISKFSSLEDFLDKLYIILDSMKLERDNKTANHFLKVSTSAATSLNPTQLKYGQLLTRYAAEFVQRQLNKKDSIVLREVVEVDRFAVDFHDSVLEVSASECSCNFRKSMLLPCSHIFAVRQKLSLDLFDASLCDRRRHAEYFKANGRVFKHLSQIADAHVAPSQSDDESLGLTMQSKETMSKHALTGPQKVKLGLQYGVSLANLHADVGTAEFRERLKLYKELERLWESGKRAAVVELVDEASSVQATGAGMDVEVIQKGVPTTGYQSTSREAHLESDTMETDDASEAAGSGQMDTELFLAVTETYMSDHTDVQDASTLHVTGDIGSAPETECPCTTPEVAEVQTRLQSVKGIKLPPRMKRCGRPRGQETTVIGLPKQRSGGRMVPFAKLPCSSKEKIMLSWFVAADEVDTALTMKQQIRLTQVQRHADLIPFACIDAAVDMRLVRKYFTDDAWEAVEAVLKAKAKSKVYTCGFCNHKLGKQSVACDGCLKWYDFKCVALKTAPKAARWFCRECRSQYASQ